jgi:hypothetical protein
MEALAEIEGGEVFGVAEGVEKRVDAGKRMRKRKSLLVEAGEVDAEAVLTIFLLGEHDRKRP